MWPEDSEDGSLTSERWDDDPLGGEKIPGFGMDTPRGLVAVA